MPQQYFTSTRRVQYIISICQLQNIPHDGLYAII